MGGKLDEAAVSGLHIGKTVADVLLLYNHNVPRCLAQHRTNNSAPPWHAHNAIT